MRMVLQRVSRAEVRVGSRVTGRIGTGFLLLVGFTGADTEMPLTWMADKVTALRLFADADGRSIHSGHAQPIDLSDVCAMSCPPGTYKAASRHDPVSFFVEY